MIELFRLRDLCELPHLFVLATSGILQEPVVLLIFENEAHTVVHNFVFVLVAAIRDMY